MSNRSKLLRLRVRNIGCMGDEPVEVGLDDVVCLVGKNNAGKSTILRAYELAQGSEKFDPARDRCSWAPNDKPSEVELELHIPKGIGNISEDWKEQQGDNLVLRSRWQWFPETGFDKKVRNTWNPASKQWADDGNAGGADNVFKSRLPRPLRVGSLQDASKTEELLLALALDPFVNEMKASQDKPGSQLSGAISAMTGLVKSMSASHEKRFEQIANQVQTTFSEVFPGLGLRLDVGMAAPSIKVADLLKAGSGIRIVDGGAETSLVQQGTGARRALFWSMLRVHNEMERTDERREEYRDGLAKGKKKAKGEALAELEAKIAAIDAGAPIPSGEDDPALPGYLLLIDEPENALHPMASRLAQRHLYQLGGDPDWQVMMTTHSPYFINPLADHTTIVRLERTKAEGGQLATRIYRSDDVKFVGDEKAQLQALQQMDVGFSEIFFGSYPVVVEGDTEHAAFIAAAVQDEHELADKVTVVRARGKAIIPALIRMLRHFKIGFGLVHDTDWPYNKAGANGMWSVNASIHDALAECRADGLAVRHRVSIPDFERFLGGEELGKDKPFEAFNRVRGDGTLKNRVRELIQALLDGKDHGPHPDKHDKTAYLGFLLDELKAWAKTNNCLDDPRLAPPEKSAA